MSERQSSSHWRLQKLSWITKRVVLCFKVWLAPWLSEELGGGVTNMDITKEKKKISPRPLALFLFVLKNRIKGKTVICKWELKSRISSKVLSGFLPPTDTYTPALLSGSSGCWLIGVKSQGTGRPSEPQNCSRNTANVRGIRRLGKGKSLPSFQ